MSADLEPRVRALEEAVVRQRAECSHALALAAMADRDIANVLIEHRETRAAVQGLQASLQTVLSQLTDRITDLAAGLERHEDMLTAVATGQAHHGELLAEILRRLPAPLDQS